MTVHLSLSLVRNSLITTWYNTNLASAKWPSLFSSVLRIWNDHVHISTDEILGLPTSFFQAFFICLKEAKMATSTKASPKKIINTLSLNYFATLQTTSICIMWPNYSGLFLIQWTKNNKPPDHLVPVATFVLAPPPLPSPHKLNGLLSHWFSYSLIRAPC